MTRIGFIGRTKSLYETIVLFSKLEEFQISFIWTCRDENYYNFQSEKFQKLANNLGVQYIYSNIVNEFSDVPDADVVVSVNFINIIPIKFIDNFKFGVINAHAGDLPRFRGNACPNWAILNDESRVALSFHKMDDGLDSGDIIKKDFFYLQKDTYIGEIYDWLDEMIPKGFVESVRRLVAGHPLEIQKGKALRVFPRKPEDSRLDFQRDLHWNYKLIRASSRPFSGAFAFLNNSETKVTVFKAQPYTVEYDFLAVSGQLIEKFNHDNSIVIAIGNQALRITDYLIDGEALDSAFRIIGKSMRSRLT